MTTPQIAAAASAAQRSRAEVFGPAGYPIGADRLDVPADIEPHGHDFCELAIVLTGHGRHDRSGRSTPLAPGSVVAVRTGEWHAYAEVDRLEVINVYVGGELVGGELAWLYDHPGLAGLVLNGGESADRLDAAALRRVAELEQRFAGLDPRTGPAGGLRRRGLLAALLAELLELDLRAQPVGPNALVRQAMALLGDDLARPWTIGLLARAVACSPSHLQHRFVEQVGVAPMAWLARARAERMAVGLLSGDTPVARLGADVGWGDPNYAARRFRAVYALSPSAYRARFGFG